MKHHKYLERVSTIKGYFNRRKYGTYLSQVDFFLKQKAGGCVLLGSSAVDENKGS